MRQLRKKKVIPKNKIQFGQVPQHNLSQVGQDKPPIKDHKFGPKMSRRPESRGNYANLQEFSKKKMRGNHYSSDTQSDKDLNHKIVPGAMIQRPQMIIGNVNINYNNFIIANVSDLQAAVAASQGDKSFQSARNFQVITNNLKNRK
jgi:hypothetical protein